MPRRRHRRTPDDVELNLTPLIDIVFLLLIFFMISTTFIQENRLRIQLPAASAQAQQQSAELEIVIDARGNYFVDGNKLINQDASTIADALEILRPASNDPTLLISADASAEHCHVVKVMDVAGRMGFERISIMTRPSAEGI